MFDGFGALCFNFTTSPFIPEYAEYELFVKEWEGKILPMNEEKHSIYEFAFLYREKSLEISRMRTAKRILKELREEKKELTEKNVKTKLKDTQKKYVNQYFETIKKIIADSEI